MPILLVLNKNHSSYCEVARVIFLRPKSERTKSIERSTDRRKAVFRRDLNTVTFLVAHLPSIGTNFSFDNLWVISNWTFNTLFSHVAMSSILPLQMIPPILISRMIGYLGKTCKGFRTGATVVKRDIDLL
jgi:hypothetical protein